MNALKIVTDTAKAFVGKASNGLRKHSPTIFVIAGAAGVVTGIVLAVKAGKESEEKTANARLELEAVRSMKDKVSEETENGSEASYTKLDYAKDLTHAYANLFLAYARVYGPPALTTLFSLFLILSSHKMLKKENAITYASLVATTKAYDSYRKNVIDAEGAEADERYRFGIKAIEQEHVFLDKNGNPKLDKEGNPKKVIDTVDILTENVLDPRSVLWAEETTTKFDFTSDSTVRYEMNLNTIKLALASANNIMRARAKDPRNNGIGYIFLNEVRDMLGVPKIDVGFICGWLYDPRLDITSDKFNPYFKAPEGWGDNKVDFGLDNPDIPGYEGRQRFLSGHEEAVLLYMNYDGPIWNVVGKRTIYGKEKSRV